MKIILDTCALIWWSLDPDKLSFSAKEACHQMEQQRNGLVSSIAIWEIAVKTKNQKLDLGVDLDEYVACLQKSRVIRIVPVDEILWLESVRLEWSHRDPADRIIVALAKSNRGSIITADREIKAFYSDIIW